MLRYRLAELDDIPALMLIRNSVRENRLVTKSIGHEEYVTALTVDGRAWLCESDGEVVGFVCGRLKQADIWALFLKQEYERRGIGSELMALVERWMFSNDLPSIVLTTAPGTRAERLYLRRGWIRVGTEPSGEAMFRLDRPADF